MPSETIDSTSKHNDVLVYPLQRNVRSDLSNIEIVMVVISNSSLYRSASLAQGQELDHDC